MVLPADIMDELDLSAHSLMGPCPRRYVVVPDTYLHDLDSVVNWARVVQPRLFSGLAVMAEFDAHSSSLYVARNPLHKEGVAVLPRRYHPR